MKLKRFVGNHLTNIPGWRTNRKIVVIESDDWGSIRMPSKEVYDKMLKKGIQVNKCPYNRFDSLASENDLNALFEVLLKFKDKQGNYPVITANTVVANPDFDKIRQSGFKEYFYEPFTATLKKYPNHSNSFELWKQGMNSKVFHPQFHGREHVNISVWLDLLQQKNEIFLQAFDLGLWGLGPNITKTGRINIQASFDSIDEKALNYQKEILKEGLDLFEKLFGYRSKSFIANNFIWDTSLNRTLLENSVTIFQGMKYQLLPFFNSTKRKMIRHHVGEVNKAGQVFLIRNCTFEPSQFPGIDSVDSCLQGISNAFFWKKPAIITAHRLNFIGCIVEGNRNNNLLSLHKLIDQILKKWPDVEFMTSVKLGELIHTNIKNG